MADKIESRCFVLVDRSGYYRTGNNAAQNILGLSNWRGLHICDVQLPGNEDMTMVGWKILQATGRAHGVTCIMGANGPVNLDFRSYVLQFNMCSVVFWPSQTGLQWLSQFLRALPALSAFRESLQYSLATIRLTRPDLLQ